MSTIQERIGILISEFEKITDWEDRYKVIIKKGKVLPAINDELKTDDYRIKGCQSELWLNAELKDETLFYTAHSDAAIVKGIVALLLEVYNGATPAEVLTTRPDFLETLGIREHLTMNRSNGLTHMLKQITFYAMAFKAKMDMNQNS